MWGVLGTASAALSHCQRRMHVHVGGECKCVCGSGSVFGWGRAQSSIGCTIAVINYLLITNGYLRHGPPWTLTPDPEPAGIENRMANLMANLMANHVIVWI